MCVINEQILDILYLAVGTGQFFLNMDLAQIDMVVSVTLKMNWIFRYLFSHVLYKNVMQSSTKKDVKYRVTHCGPFTAYSEY